MFSENGRIACMIEAQSSSSGGRPPLEVDITEVNQLITGVADP